VVQYALERGQGIEKLLTLLEAAAHDLDAERRQTLTRSLWPVRLSKDQPYLPGWMAHSIVAGS